jgi:hypothetical protein
MMLCLLLCLLLMQPLIGGSIGTLRGELRDRSLSDVAYDVDEGVRRSAGETVASSAEEDAQEAERAFRDVGIVHPSSKSPRFAAASGKLLCLLRRTASFAALRCSSLYVCMLPTKPVFALLPRFLFDDDLA